MVSITWKEYNELCDKLDNSGLNVRFIEGGYYGTNVIFINNKQITSANYEYEDFQVEKEYWELFLNEKH